MFDGQTICVTGGTGSFGTAFIERLLTEHDPRRVRSMSRGIGKIKTLRARMNDSRLTAHVGDVRERERCLTLFERADIVVHAAALKDVDVGEEEVEEFKRTNIDGTYNVLWAARQCRVGKVLFLSTDKASGPSTAYGTTKSHAEHAVVSFGAYNSPEFPTIFAASRYGNVAGSARSVIPSFRECAALGQPLPITSVDMTRFYMLQREAVDLVLLALDRMVGGELFIPKLASFRVVDLAEAIDPGGKREIVGIRGIEKIHETLINRDEVQMAWDCGDCYVLSRKPHGRPVPNFGWEYSSETAEPRLTVEQLRERLKDV